MISLRGPKLKIFAGVLAFICVIAGIYFNFIRARGFEKTTATIVSIRESVDETDDSINRFPTVEYVVDGKVYTGELSESSPSYKVGKTLRVAYDPNKPSVVYSDGPFKIYILAVGLVILAFVIVSTIREKKSQAQFRQLREEHGQTRYRPSVQGEERELYFLTDLGTAKYGHRLEDRERRVLYEARMTKFTLTQPFGFDFIDHEHQTSTPHLVGHSEESQWDTLLLDNHSTFELDGVDVFKHLKQNGISVDSSYSAGGASLVGLRYRILRDGVEIARAESTSQYPHEEDAEAHKVAGLVPVPGFYRVWTTEQNLDLLFVTLLAFARTGASDDRGGNYGALLGTLKNIGK